MRPSSRTSTSTSLMRQDSSVESLREKLPQALEALDKIK